MVKYSFCHGWAINPVDFTEVTCRNREKCAYFDVEFYRKHGNHLEEFEELFPFDPCGFFFPKQEAKNIEKEER